MRGDVDSSAILGSEDPTFWSHLGSLGIRGIELERNRIRSERESLSVGTRSLAFDNYQTFIAAAECGKDVAKHLEEARTHAEKGLSNKLPPLRQACLEFESRAQELAARRKSTSLVLAKHTKLLEVLELPQLAETCVRSGQYEEALELKQYVMRLKKKLGNIPIVAEVVQSVQGACNAMLNQLLNQLRAPIALPACLKVVGYLRRMEVFGETELRLRFLQARDVWLTSLLKTVPTDNPYDHLTKTMELTRVNLFDIVTQYRALFSDDDPLLALPGSNPASNRILFSSWLERKISNFLLILKEDLNRGAKNQSLDSIIGQAMYFGQSFGRIGADFRLSLVDIFIEAVREVCLHQLEGAEDRFKTAMFHLALKASVSKSREEQTNNSISHNDVNPPVSLLDFMPLADLCNVILNSLNELRLIAPTSLGPEVTSRIQTILENAALVLFDRERQMSKSSTTETERSAFQRLVLAFSNDLLVYINNCLSKVFPALDLHSLSTSATTSLRLDEIRKLLPLQHLVILPPPRPLTDKSLLEMEAETNAKQTTSPFVIDRADLMDEAMKDTAEAENDPAAEIVMADDTSVRNDFRF